MTIKFGDYVATTKHGYTGRAYRFTHLTNAEQGWVDSQNVKVTVEQIQEEWVGILCHGGGSVLVPMSTCRIIPPIKKFSHPCAKEYFK